jgi:hypothetical protein
MARKAVPFIDLDAAAREVQFPDGIPLRKGGKDFLLPAELPADVFDPFLSEELDLVGLFQQVLSDRAEDSEESIGGDIIDMLIARPALPRQFIAALYEGFEVLFGTEQYAEFKATRPSVADYLRLVKGLMPLYGTSLGEAFASPASSASAGATPKPISPSTTGSTPATASATPKTPAS